MRIETIQYQKTKGGPWHWGLFVNEGDGPILDNKGHEVKEVWDYRRVSMLVVELPQLDENPN